MATPDATTTSYRIHVHARGAYSRNGARARQAAAWLNQGTISHWWFERTYACADPLLEDFPGAGWLTIGDGRYGMDALYLQARGTRVIASDVFGTLLDETRVQGLMQEFQVENAEALGFENHFYDFCFLQGILPSISKTYESSV